GGWSSDWCPSDLGSPRAPPARIFAAPLPTFLQVYPPGANALNVKRGAAKMRAEAARGLPAAITVNVTGYQPIEEATKLGSSGGSSVLLEGLIGGLGALIILLFVFGTLPAVLMPLVVAVAAIAS